MYRKKQQANIVKQERELIRKEINKLDKIYLRQAIDKRLEVQVLQEASRMRQEINMERKKFSHKLGKEDQINKEKKAINKKDKEARKLQVLEAEVLKGLRDTHIKQ